MNVIGHVPKRFQTRAERVLLYEEREAYTMSDVEMDALIHYMREEAVVELAKHTVEQIICAIDQAIHLLLDRNSVIRQQLECDLTRYGAYDNAFVKQQLSSYLRQFRAEELRRFLVEDFGNYHVLDTFQPRVTGGLAKAYAPVLTTHIWSGNVPGVSLWSLISNLLTKGPLIGRVSTREPFVASAFAQALSSIAPSISEAIAIMTYPYDASFRYKLYEASEVVVAYGHNDTLATIAREVPVTTRFLGYGHKMSFGVIGKETLNHYHIAETVARMAKDVAAFDQQGCYSPHFFFVEAGGKWSAERVAHALYHELRQLDVRYPIQEATLADKQQIQRFYSEASIRALQSDSFLLKDERGRFGVKYEPDVRIEPSPLNRHVTVMPYEDMNQLTHVLRPYRHYLQTASIHMSRERMQAWTESLGAIGVTRFAAVGTMTETKAGWHHDGRFSLLDFVRMCDIDASVLHESERYVSYRD